MRTIFILRGAPGSGKSTWINNNHLEPYTIAPDTIRIELQSPMLDIYGEPLTSQNNDHLVWQRVMEVLEMRMSRGDFTVIDATHYNHDLLNKYSNLIKQYRYRAYIVDFTSVSLETILKQNQGRENYKRVPEDRIRYIYGIIEDGQYISNRYTIVTPEEAVAILHKPLYIDWNERYEHVAVFGDIHGCFDPIQKYFAQYPYDEHTLYVFVGDYIDRGIQNREVMDFFISNLDKPNFLFLEGNHEKWLRRFSKKSVAKETHEDPEWFSPQFAKYTAHELEPVNKKKIRIFCNRLAQMAYAKFGTKTYCITHGGIPIQPNLLISTEQLIKGVGDYDDLDKLYATWLQKTPEDHVLIHGHRNLYEIGTKVNNRIFNLCSPIEFGGNLRILHIGKDDNIDVIEIPNTVYKLPQETTPSFIPKTNEEWLKMLDASKLIMKKELSGGITSYNFTRDAFKNSKWNELTCKARGLFVKDGRVVCRSYDKFGSMQNVVGCPDVVNS
jgi:predicted kinase